MIKPISRPSLNFDKRRLPISMLVLHYTGMETGEAALERLCNPQAKVSAHYLIETDGRIFSLVEETDRAWHAGVATWQNISDINSASIGIEIVNGGHDYGLPSFPSRQIEALIHLIHDIQTRYDIPSDKILGHSDVAPDRKQDPGERFPWKHLAENGIGYFPSLEQADRRTLFEHNSRNRGISIVQMGLAHIGYRVEITGRLDEATGLVLTAFQRRYRPEKIDGLIDVETLALIKWLAENGNQERLSAQEPQIS